MRVPTRRNGLALVLFILGFALVTALAFASTTWAAPNAQGTVPTPPKPTGQPTARPTVNSTAQPTAINIGGGNNGGGNNGGNGNNSGNQDNGSGNTGSTPGAQAVPLPNTVCAIVESGAQCMLNELNLVVSAGAAPSGSTVTMDGSFGQPPCPASPVGIIFLNRCYRFHWTDANAQPVTALGGPVQHCMMYGAEQSVLTGNRPENMLIGFAGADGVWSVVKPAIDTAAGRVCATTNQAVMWTGLFAPQAAPALLPTTGEGVIGWLFPLMVTGILLMLAAWRIRRKHPA